MALKGISFEATARRASEYRVGPIATAGFFYSLGSTAGYLRAALTSEVSHVLEWNVTAAGIQDFDILRGAEVRATKVGDPARVFELQPGDLVLTDQLASGSATGALDGTTVAGTALSFFNGLARVVQTGDTKLAEVSAVQNANRFNSDGTVWIHIVRLA